MTYTLRFTPEVEHLLREIAAGRDSEDPGPGGAAARIPGVVQDAFELGLELLARAHHLPLPAALRSGTRDALDQTWGELVSAIDGGAPEAAVTAADRLLTAFLRSRAAPSWSCACGEGPGDRGVFDVLRILLHLCERAAEAHGAGSSS